MTVQESFAAIPLFAGLSAAELGVLTSRAVTKAFPKNTVLMQEGDHADALYLILSGMVKVYASDAEGKEILLNTFGPGEYFGELAIIDDEPRSASVITVEPCKIAMIARHDFLECLRNHASIAISLLKVLAGKLRQQTDATKSLALMGVYERLVKTLHELAVPKNGQLVIENVTHKILADRVYSSREMITVILKELKLGGYISGDRGTIIINKRLPAKW
ncbi:MAG: Crp/Fnr family transcriptional regulator [Gammaproteobacteria bacterium]